MSTQLTTDIKPPKYKFVSDVIVNRDLYPERPNLLKHRSEQMLEMEAGIFRKLHDLLLSIEPYKLGDHYFRAVLDVRDLYTIMPLLKSEERINLALDCMNYAENNQIHRDFSYTYFQGMLHFIKAEEKAVLLKEIVANPLSMAKQLYIEEIFFSARDLKNLNFLVKTSGIDKETKIRNRDLKECISTAVLGTALARMPIPTKPKVNSTISETNHKLDEIKKFLKDALVKLESFKGYARTDSYREYKSGLKSIIFYLGNLRGYCGRRFKDHNPAYELRELARELIEMTKVLFKYKFSLSIKNTKVASDKELQGWNVDEIAYTEDAIKLLGAGRVLVTPWLTEMVRVSYCDWIARRTEKGPIVISDSAIDDPAFKRIYPNVPLFLATALHEMSHGVQYVRQFSPQLEYEPITLNITGPSDERSGYAEHCRLSDWKIVSKKTYALDKDMQGIKVKGQFYRFELPEWINGEKRILLHSEQDGQVLSRMADARFGFHRQIDCVPEEDYVEHQTDYFFLKDKAMHFAPDKFLFCERRFRRYDSNVTVQRELAKALDKLMGGVLTIQDLYENPDMVFANASVAPDTQPPLPNIVPFAQPQTLEDYSI